MRSFVPKPERQRFLDHWLDYVLELGVAENRKQALAYYGDTRSWLLDRLGSGGIEVHRALLVPEGTDPTSYLGTDTDVGRFWTTDRTVALNWSPGGDYGDVPTPESGTIHVLSAHLDAVEQIDLVETIACRLGSDWEQEIRLAQGFHPVITAIEPQRRNLSARMP